MKAWWLPKGSPAPSSPDTRNYEPQIEARECRACGRFSPLIYKDHWFCTNIECKGFSRACGALLPHRLSFTEEFLAERMPYNVGCFRPRLQSFESTTVPEPDSAMQYYSRDAWRGKVCPQCKGCMARIYWEGYHCRTPDCGYVEEPKFYTMSAKVCYQGFFNATNGHSWSDARVRARDVILERPSRIEHEWNIKTFELSQGCTFTLFSSNLPENGRPGGSEAMFEALQRTRIGLSRRIMCGNSLTRHFAVNHGMHYKYHAHHGTTPFKDSPPIIHVGLSQLQWAARYVAGENVDPINELLTVAYLQDMKMNYHDDGEATVGNTIVSLSLGHPAIMSFKMKDKIYNLHELNADNYDPSVPVIRGSRLWQEREELNAAWDKMTERMKTIRLNKILRAIERDRKPSPVLFEATLKFGDMMVMHGEHFQKIYDHGVTPQGGMRFALTGRHMKLDKFPMEEHWKGDVEIDPRYAYSPDHRHVREIPEPKDERAATMMLSPVPTERSGPEALQQSPNTSGDQGDISPPSTERDPMESPALSTSGEIADPQGTSQSAASCDEDVSHEVTSIDPDGLASQHESSEGSIDSGTDGLAISEDPSRTGPATSEHEVDEPNSSVERTIDKYTPVDPSLALARELGWCAPGVASLYHAMPNGHLPAPRQEDVHESTEHAGGRFTGDENGCVDASTEQ